MTEFERVRHLALRAGFGLHVQELNNTPPFDAMVDRMFRKSRDQAIILPEGELAKLRMEESKKKRRELSRGSLRTLRREWIEVLAKPAGSELEEKMALFWHGHFACRVLFFPGLAQKYLRTLRTHALGNFRDLVLAIAREPAMLLYLNNQQNKKDSPNENFARELMELFTLGRAHYSESDVKEAARAFTGWTTNLAGKYVFREEHHDFGQKSFLGKVGNFNGEDIIRIILQRKQAALFLAGKICRHFVSPHVAPEHIWDIATTLYCSDYDIRETMHFLLTRDWFYAAEYQGVRVKSPIELIVGLKRAIALDFENNRTIQHLLRLLGQVPFDPPNVAGWPGGHSWIDHSTLLTRLNLPQYALGSGNVRSRETRKISASLDSWSFAGNLNTSEIVRHFYARSPERDLLATIPGTIDPKNDSRAIAMLFSIPEFQLC